MFILFLYLFVAKRVQLIVIQPPRLAANCSVGQVCLATNGATLPTPTLTVKKTLHILWVIVFWFVSPYVFFVVYFTALSQ
jgi:hypothetical protein